MAIDNSSTSRRIARSSSKAATTPHKVCFRALNEIDNAMTDLGGTIAATLRLADAEMEDDPTRDTFFTSMERHLTRDMEAAGRAFTKAFHEILEHAEGWRPTTAKGGAR